MNGWESDIVPRDFIPCEQPDLQTFGAGGVNRRTRIGETTAEYNQHLTDSGDGENRQYAFDLDVRAGLFPGLADSACLERLTKLQIAGGQRPKPQPRFDG